MKYPEWIIPHNTNKFHLLSEAQEMLKAYQLRKNRSDFICVNCGIRNLTTLLRTVESSLQYHTRSLERNMGLPDCQNSKEASNLRIEWLRQLEDKLKGLV